MSSSIVLLVEIQLAMQELRVAIRDLINALPGVPRAGLWRVLWRSFWQVEGEILTEHVVNVGLWVVKEQPPPAP